MVIYPVEGAFHKRLDIATIREHLCEFYQLGVNCVDSGTKVDPNTGHTVCLGCNRIKAESGLRVCDICEREYINKSKYENPKSETNCPRCEQEYGI